VLAYLARYTHRVAISSSRVIGADEQGVTFKYKDYRSEGPGRYKTMTVAPGEFIRRFMLHILPKGFHRIRHYGLLARSRTKADTLARARELIDLARPVHKPQPQTNQDHAPAGTEAIEQPVHPCPCCGSPMVIIETFVRAAMFVQAGVRNPSQKPTFALVSPGWHIARRAAKAKRRTTTRLAFCAIASSRAAQHRDHGRRPTDPYYT
jgi:hypothetical protein